jgi:hypothetical protein
VSLLNLISSFFKSMRAVLWGFLGVRRGSLSFVHVIIAAVIGVIGFMTILLLIVRAVLAS